MEDLQNIAVIFGGKSVEHDISIITGLQVLMNLDREKYNVVAVYMSKKNKFYIGKDLEDIEFYKQDNFERQLKEVVILNGGILARVGKLGIKKICRLDFVFLALHGGVGEGGSVQGLLDVFGVKYSSPDVLGSSIGQNKHLTKLLCKSLDINTTKYVVLDSSLNIEKRVKDLRFPLIIKPNTLGSSIGLSVAKDLKTCIESVEFALMFDNKVIVEEAVVNKREFNIAVLHSKTGYELSSIEEVTNGNSFLSFEDKYLESDPKYISSGHILGANIDKKLKLEIINNSKKICDCLGLDGCIRIDYLYDNDKLYLNEINTIPGSFANYLWGEKGYSFSQLLDKVKEGICCKNINNGNKITEFSSNVLKNFSQGGKIVK